MVDILKDTMSYAIAITPDTPRGLDKEILSELLLVNGVPATTACNAEEAITMAYDMAEPEDVVMVCGSLRLRFKIKILCLQKRRKKLH